MSITQRATLADGYEISRIIKGGWQLSGDHGEVDPEGALDDMARYVEAGITTFDCADIYTGVEEMIGKFRARYLKSHGSGSLDGVRIHTKFVPDLSGLATMDKASVERIIDRSLTRLKMDRLDLVQFSWWSYDVARYVEVAGWLKDLQQKGKIEKVGMTNFDTQRLQEIVDAGVTITSMQVQYSLLDQRPAKRMTPFAMQHGFRYLCYGTVAGGFLSDRWLGQAEPTEISNRSLIKYKLIIEDFGGWALFQELLSALSIVARKHGVSIATIASCWVLDQPNVAAAIVGVRRADHLPEHQKIFSTRLDAEDHAIIAAVLTRANPIEGDVYSVERDIRGRHGRIMKYELNDAAPSV